MPEGGVYGRQLLDTARLGHVSERTFDHLIQQEVFIALTDRTWWMSRIQALVQHSVHQALAECAKLRPPVDISVV
jgi:hypothetical protein